jgi:hypothetical protein
LYITYICAERDSFSSNTDDDDNWLCSSGFRNVQGEHDDEHICEDEVKEENKEYKELQKFTSQQWLEGIENRYLDARDGLVHQSFQAALNDVEKPYSFILDVMRTAFFDLYSKRIPITFYALVRFKEDKWRKSSNAS